MLSAVYPLSYRTFNRVEDILDHFVRVQISHEITCRCQIGTVLGASFARGSGNDDTVRVYLFGCERHERRRDIVDPMKGSEVPAMTKINVETFDGQASSTSNATDLLCQSEEQRRRVR